MSRMGGTADLTRSSFAMANIGTNLSCTTITKHPTHPANAVAIW